MKTEILNRLLQDRKAKRQFAVLTHMDSGAQAIVYTDGEIHGDLAVDDQRCRGVVVVVDPQYDHPADDSGGPVSSPSGGVNTICRAVPTDRLNSCQLFIRPSACIA